MNNVTYIYGILIRFFWLSEGDILNKYMKNMFVACPRYAASYID